MGRIHSRQDSGIFSSVPSGHFGNARTPSRSRRGPFKARLGIDTEVEAALVVRDLQRSSPRTLEANDRDLPLYAEAAPTEFLSIIERDLKTSSPAVFGLLRPAGSGIFGSPSRTGLLWALEGLAWNPETLPRTVMILARLAQVRSTTTGSTNRRIRWQRYSDRGCPRPQPIMTSAWRW